MALEAIGEIKKAEIQGEEIISKAKARSRDLIKSASIKMEAEYKKIIESAENEYNIILQDAEKNVEKRSIPILNEGKEKVDEITNIPQERFNNAVNMVVERIVNMNGNS
jgi:V/A-type H+-transporting ATPase subunit G/H